MAIHRRETAASGACRRWVLLTAILVCFLSASTASADGPSAFQPAFHQAMRNWTWRSPTATFRIKIPIGRSGTRVRVSFKAGDGPLQIHAATIALAGSNGVLASPPVPLLFAGAPSVSLNNWTRVTSDPAAFSAAFGSDVYVSFEFEGAPAATTINAFPDTFEWEGSHASDMHPPPGRPLMRVSGVNTIDVEGAPSRALVAIGDSITEGYITSDLGPYVAYSDDTRNAWPSVAQRILQLPFVNAAVSAQGLDDAGTYLSADVLVLQGITDCAVLLGTNDLGSKPAEEIEAKLAALFDRLRPFCRVWAGTLMPREADAPSISAKRHAVNDWVRQRAVVADVIDFEAALTSPADRDHFRPGLVHDGIHPTIEGQRQMGTEAAKILSSPTLTAISPTRAPSDRATTITLSGTGFKPAATVSFGASTASSVQVISDTEIRAAAPPSAPGKADVKVVNRDGLSFTLPQAFEYEGTQPVPPPDSPPPDTRPPASSHGCGTAQGDTLSSVILSVLWVAFFPSGARASRRRAHRSSRS